VSKLGHRLHSGDFVFRIEFTHPTRHSVERGHRASVGLAEAGHLLDVTRALSAKLGHRA
jgi:hypothetical protein